MSILLNSPQQIFFILQICTAIYSFKSDSRELFLNLTFSPFIYNSLSNPFDSTHTYSQISLYSCHPSPVIIYHLILLFPICSSHRNQKNSLRTQKKLIITSPCLITSQVTNPQPSLPAYAKSDPPALTCTTFRIAFWVSVAISAVVSSYCSTSAQVLLGAQLFLPITLCLDHFSYSFKFILKLLPQNTSLNDSIYIS